MDLQQVFDAGSVVLARVSAAWSQRLGFSPQGFGRSALPRALEPARLEHMLECANMQRALARAVREGGEAGVDGMHPEALKTYLREHWTKLEPTLRAGKYVPRPLRAIGADARAVPTAFDRMIHHAIVQILRPRLRAHGVPELRREEILERSIALNAVDHRELIARVARYVDDPRLLDLIRAALRIRVSRAGVVSATRSGLMPDAPLGAALAGLALERNAPRWRDELRSAWRTEQRYAAAADVFSVLDAPQRVHWISELKAGRLGILSRPPGDGDLATEVADWAEAGLDVVICLLKPSEFRADELKAARELWTRHNIEFIAFPVKAGGVPASESVAKALADRVAALLREGASVGIHRRGSAGRTRLVTAVILQGISFTRAQALATVRKACGLPENAPLLDNDIQESWLAAYRREIAQPGMFARFLVPESEVSLKLWFDNLRNYFICAALYVPLSRSEQWTSTPAWLAFLFGMLIVVLPAINTLQTFALAKRTLAQVNRWIVKRAANMRPPVRQLLRWITAPLLVALFLIIAVASVSLVLMLMKIVT